MLEITFGYWNKLADQLISICSLLGGFSIALIANLVVAGAKTRLTNNIMIAATLAASFFLISIFSMTKILMMTTEGYPVEVVETDFMLPRVVGFTTFLFGILSLIVVISLAGWTKSKAIGKITTIIGILTFIMIIVMIN